MIGKLASAMGRRGILRGALGLGAAVGIAGAGQVSRGPHMPQPMPPSLGGLGLMQQGGLATQASPDWLRAMEREAEAVSEAEMNRPRVDTLDLDLAALRGPSPAWKLLQQKARDKARREAARTIWQRVEDAATRWRRSIGRWPSCRPRRRRMARKRKPGDRYPGGQLKHQRVDPTPEMALKRMKELGRMDVSLDHPIDVMHAKGLLSRSAEDPAEAERRRDAGRAFANLAFHVFGQPFATIDSRSRRMVAPSINQDDADDIAAKEARARQTDTRTPEERAEAVRRRFDAMLALVGRGTIREWVLRKVAVFCVPLQQLARSPSKREQLRLHLLDALDAIGDESAVRRTVDGMRRAA